LASPRGGKESARGFVSSRHGRCVASRPPPRSSTWRTGTSGEESVEAGADDDRWKVPYLDMVGKGRNTVALAPAM
jgi:hypothetical protein